MKLRIQLSIDFTPAFECSETGRLSGVLRRTMGGLRATLCRLGLHNLVEVEERSCCWGGVDRCTRCGKEELWSNSYR